jgi:hypothetical protein
MPIQFLRFVIIGVFCAGDTDFFFACRLRGSKNLSPLAEPVRLKKDPFY